MTFLCEPHNLSLKLAAIRNSQEQMLRQHPRAGSAFCSRSRARLAVAKKKQWVIGEWRRAGRLMSPVNQLKTQLQREVAAKQQEQQQAQQQMAQTHMLQQQQVAGNPQQVLTVT